MADPARCQRLSTLSSDPCLTQAGSKQQIGDPQHKPNTLPTCLNCHIFICHKVTAILRQLMRSPGHLPSSSLRLGLRLCLCTWVASGVFNSSQTQLQDSYIGQVTTLHLSSLRIQESSGKVQGITRRTWSQHTRRAWDRGIWQVGAIQDAVHKTLGWGHTQARSGSLCHGLFLIKAGFLPAPVGDRLHTVRSVLVLVASTAYDRFDFCPGLAGLAGGRQTHKEASNLMTQTSYIWLGGLENPRVTISATVSSSHPLLSWVDRCLSNSRLASVVSRDLLVANHFFSSSCFS